MSKESYARGFAKAAEAAGVDPKELAKFAQSIVGPVPSAKDIMDASKGYGSTMKLLGKYFSKYMKGMAGAPALAAKKGLDAARTLKRMAGRGGDLGPLLANKTPDPMPRPDYGGYGSQQAYEDAYQQFNP